MWNLGTFLKNTAFLINLASFLPINPNVVLPQNHAIVQETKKELKDLSFIEGVLENNKGTKPYRVHFNSHVSRAKKREDKENVFISIPELYANLPTNDYRPSETSMAHYQYFTSHRFSKYISYSEFCRLEKSMASIVEEYLQDEQRSYIIFLDDIFIQPMGMRKYWTFPKNYIVFSTSSFSDSFVDFVIVERFENVNFL
jgi:hypothetical protein